MKSAPSSAQRTLFVGPPVHNVFVQQSKAHQPGTLGLLGLPGTMASCYPHCGCIDLANYEGIWKDFKRLEPTARCIRAYQGPQPL